MRSGNVLVTIHGSGSNNALFMAEGSTLVEIRPYQFGTKSHEWANTFMPQVGFCIKSSTPAYRPAAYCMVHIGRRLVRESTMHVSLDSLQSGLQLWPCRRPSCTDSVVRR